MRNMLLRHLPLVILSAGGLAAWGLSGLSEAPSSAATHTPLPVVEVIEVQANSQRLSVKTHGSVSAHAEIELIAEVAGRVLNVAPALLSGGFFEAGDVLVEIDARDIQLQKRRAAAALARARSEASLSEDHLKRMAQLAGTNVASDADLSEAQHRHAIAKASVEDARAALEQVERDLERTRLRAPFAGRVRTRRVDAGQVVAAGTSLAEIYAVDYAEVQLPVLVTEMAYLEFGDLGGVSSEAEPNVILSAEYGGRRVYWRGRIVRTAGEIDRRSRMLHVVARVDDPYGLASASEQPPLTLGLFVEAEILGKTLEDVFVLPRSALNDGSSVLVVDAAGATHRRSVRVVRSETERVLVREGLVAGEQVLRFASQVVAGERVRVLRGDRDQGVDVDVEQVARNTER